MDRRRMMMAKRQPRNIFDPLDFFSWLTTIPLTQPANRASRNVVSGRDCISLNGGSDYVNTKQRDNYYVFSTNAIGKTFRIEFDKIDTITASGYVCAPAVIYDMPPDRSISLQVVRFDLNVDTSKFSHYSFLADGFTNGMAALHFSYISKSNYGWLNMDISSFKIYEL